MHHSLYQKGCRKRAAGKFLIISGGAELAIGSLCMIFAAVGIDDGESFIASMVFYSIAVPSVAVGIPLLVSGTRNKNNAVDVFNQTCSNNAVSLNLDIGSNGIGLNLTF